MISNKHIDDSLIDEAKEVYEKRLETIEKAKQESYISDKKYDYWKNK